MHSDRTVGRGARMGSSVSRLEPQSDRAVGGERSEHRTVATPLSGHGFRRTRVVRKRRVASRFRTSRPRRRGIEARWFPPSVVARGSASLRRGWLPHPIGQGPPGELCSRNHRTTRATHLPSRSGNLGRRSGSVRTIPIVDDVVEGPRAFPQRVVLAPRTTRRTGGLHLLRVAPR